ncbi:hypothetical protein HQ520_15120 [bacterium]|nr:hypothetical protein [bacterium]
METMTCRERMLNAIDRRPVDLLPATVTPWPETVKRWTSEGHIQEGEDLVVHFDQDLRGGGWINCTADLDFEPVTLEEDADTILVLDGNGAKLRRHKRHSATPEHVDFSVKDLDAWETKIKPHLQGFDQRRINFEAYEKARRKTAEEERFFAWTGMGTFESVSRVSGHEYMLLGMATDPDWVLDMMMTYADMMIRHLEQLFSEKGTPDGLFFFEDLGFKNKPFMSPAMFEHIVMPSHQRLFDFAHSKGCKVLLHSCGFVEPLVPYLVDAGIDCLQAMEVKAGMDMPRLARQFGDRIAFFGNIDARALIANDRGWIDRELETKIPPVLEMGGGYILHSDHSEPPEVNYETIQYFLEKGRRMGV